MQALVQAEHLDLGLENRRQLGQLVHRGAHVLGAFPGGAGDARDRVHRARDGSRRLRLFLGGAVYHGDLADNFLDDGVDGMERSAAAGDQIRELHDLLRRVFHRDRDLICLVLDAFDARVNLLGGVVAILGEIANLTCEADAT